MKNKDEHLDIQDTSLDFIYMDVEHCDIDNIIKDLIYWDPRIRSDKQKRVLHEIQT